MSLLISSWNGCKKPVFEGSCARTTGSKSTSGKAKNWKSCKGQELESEKGQTTLYNRGNLNRYTKRPLQDSARNCSTPGMGESALDCTNHRVSCKFQQPTGWKIHRFFRWRMPFAVSRSGSGVSDTTNIRSFERGFADREGWCHEKRDSDIFFYAFFL